jgi:predicted DNA-binding transcriptional regulator AlpA
MPDHPCKCNAAPPLSDDLRVLDSRDAAAALGISSRTLFRLTVAGRLPVVRISRRCLRYRLSDLRAFIDAGQKAKTP